MDDFVNRLKWIYEIVKENMKDSNTKYKLAADKSRKEKISNAGDLVMIHLQKGHFPAGTYSKLRKQNFDPCQILKRSTPTYTLPTFISISCLRRVMTRSRGPLLLWKGRLTWHTMSLDLALQLAEHPQNIRL